MLKTIQQRDLDRNRWIKITMSVILGLICVSMVVTLVPGIMTGSLQGGSPDAVATVGGPVPAPGITRGPPLNAVRSESMNSPHVP